MKNRIIQWIARRKCVRNAVLESVMVCIECAPRDSDDFRLMIRGSMSYLLSVQRLGGLSDFFVPCTFRVVLVEHAQ